MKFPIFKLDDHNLNKFLKYRLYTTRHRGPPENRKSEDFDKDSCEFWIGEGENCDLNRFVKMKEKVDNLVNDNFDTSDKDQVEGLAACEIYDAIKELKVPTEILDNPDFWTFLNCQYLWKFIVWRQTEAFKFDSDDEIEFSPKIKSYILGKSTQISDCVARRMYLRVHCLGGPEFACANKLSFSVKDGTDFWRSHIIRVRTGQRTNVVRQMVSLQSNDEFRLVVTPMREFAKKLRRSLTNRVMLDSDDENSNELVDDLWEKELPGK